MPSGATKSAYPHAASTPPGAEHALALGEEGCAFEPVQCLRDRDELHARVGQRGAFAGFNRHGDVVRPAPRPVLGDLLHARLRGVHMREARGESTRRLAATATGLPDLRIA
jgi:hypothetical protein